MLDIWTEPATERFVELTNDHSLYYSQIAATLSKEFHTTFSKNACIGKAKRLGLPERDTAIPGRPKKKREWPKKKNAPLAMYSRAQRIKALKDGRPPRRYPTRKPRPPAGGVHLLDLKHHHCRYIVGDLRFCGEQKIDDSSYCEAHHRLTHTTRR